MLRLLIAQNLQDSVCLWEYKVRGKNAAKTSSVFVLMVSLVLVLNSFEEAVTMFAVNYHCLKEMMRK